jgi:hypothetical protein
MKIEFLDKTKGYKAKIATTKFYDAKRDQDVLLCFSNEEHPVIEVYSGPNYVEPFNSKKKSYSRVYNYLSKVPNKYWRTILALIDAYDDKWGEK